MWPPILLRPLDRMLERKFADFLDPRPFRAPRPLLFSQARIAHNDCFGMRNILEDEVIWLKGVYAVDTYLSGGASSLFIEEALLPPELGEGLAWESGNVYVDSAVGVVRYLFPIF